MAAANRATLTLRPEQSLAALLVSKMGLSPPIDVRALAEQKATVEHAQIPFDCDALLVRSSETSKPRIVLALDRPRTRERFTLAHEIGHLAIPWHLGDIACHVEPDAHAGSTYWTLEAEASRFASSLLMPAAWLAGLVAAHEPSQDLPALHQEIGIQAQTSLIASGLALCTALPPGTVFAAVDVQSKLVRAAAASPGTVAHPPRRRSAMQQGYGATAGIHATHSDNYFDYYWWTYSENDWAPSSRTRNRDTRQPSIVLEHMLLDCGFSGSEVATAYARVNGLVGAIFKHDRPETAESFHQVLRERLADKPDLAAIVDHPDYGLFITRRLRALKATRRR